MNSSRSTPRLNHEAGAGLIDRTGTPTSVVPTNESAEPSLRRRSLACKNLVNWPVYYLQSKPIDLPAADTLAICIPIGIVGANTRTRLHWRARHERRENMPSVLVT